MEKFFAILLSAACVFGTVNSYTLAYNANGGAGSMTSISVDYGATVTLAASAFSRTDYVQTKWNTAADGSGTDYALGGSFTMGAGNVTLYAQWSPKWYVISFGNSNMALGGSANLGSYYVTSKYGAGSRQLLNLSVSGRDADTALKDLRTAFSYYNPDSFDTGEIILAHVTNTAGHDEASGVSRADMESRWYAKNDTMIQLVRDSTGLTRLFLGPPPVVYDEEFPDRETRLLELSGSAYELCVNLQIKMQEPYYELCRRDDIAYSNEFSGTWRASSDKIHYKNPEGLQYAGLLLASADIPTRNRYFGAYGWPKPGYHPWASCWLNGDSVPDDTGALAIVENDEILSPAIPIGRYNQSYDITVTIVGDHCADVYMRCFGHAFTAGNTVVPWIKTSRLKRPPGYPLVQWKLVGTASGNIKVRESWQ
jgi:hypothetical protein